MAITYQESGFTSPSSPHSNGSSHEDSAYPRFTDMEGRTEREPGQLGLEVGVGGAGGVQRGP